MKIVFLSILLILTFVYNGIFSPNQAKVNFTLDPDKSIVEWSGASPKVSHQGSFAVTCQELQITDEQIQGGTFVIPIASIKNYDLPKAIKPVLLKHLKSKDFFNLALYPEAIFKITQVEPLIVPAVGDTTAANTRVTGDLTLLGQTHAISFPAKIEVQENNVLVDAAFKLDRTQWGMNYAADPALDNRHIFPEVAIRLKVAGSRN
ncbi:YceI family protein [Adhaeribacter swui]|uniref:YceI family protein n=1 Tax=Adhaeribacter swui TaxID=2086471 RepID=A0A7G7GAQ3_9BACT|nr:YceI family protein [Adhaeribacter swui]QNF34237.1 YceI family protein [Adhaeribacter swui]